MKKKNPRFLIPQNPDAPTTSWWIKGSREAFKQALEAELPRMKAKRVNLQSDGIREIGTFYGRI